MAIEAITLDVKETPAESQTAEMEPSTTEPNSADTSATDTKSEDSTTDTTKTNGDAEESVDNSEDKTPEQSTEDKVAEPEAKGNKPEENQRKNADTRKQQLNNEIRDKIAERNALRQEIAELNQQKYQLKTPDDLPSVETLMQQQNPETGDYYTRTEAKLALIEAERRLEREQQQMNAYTENIVSNRLRLKDEADQALRDFPMFDDQSPNYNKELADQANEIAARLIVKDNNTGEIIGSNGSIYQVYAAIANAAKAAETSGKIAGREAAVKMMNSADVVGSGAPIASDDENDPVLKAFENARNRY